MYVKGTLNKIKVHLPSKCLLKLQL